MFSAIQLPDPVKTRKAGWRSAKHAQQWANTLEAYAYPMLGDVPVADIDMVLVLKVIEPMGNQDGDGKSGARSHRARCWRRPRCGGCDRARTRQSGATTSRNPA